MSLFGKLESYTYNGSIIWSVCVRSCHCIWILVLTTCVKLWFRECTMCSIDWTTQTKLYVSSLFLFCRTFYSLILPLMFVCHFVCFLSCTLPPNSSTLYSLFHFFNFVADYKIVDSRSNWWQDLGDCKSPKSRFIKIKDMFMCNKKKEEDMFMCFLNIFLCAFFNI